MRDYKLLSLAMESCDGTKTTSMEIPLRLSSLLLSSIPLERLGLAIRIRSTIPSPLNIKSGNRAKCGLNQARGEFD